VKIYKNMRPGAYILAQNFANNEPSIAKESAPRQLPQVGSIGSCQTSA